ncbi:MAG TPA: substrate-binding domain-containing protein, partial [Pirellulales bacterium]|nr:substrate-binding domain-containing protein [Pirellulales bacterium]
LQNGFYQPGDRFLSIRDVAELFDVSYQTAHRLIAELCDEGLLERRPQSGTYVPGGPRTLAGAQLAFAQRAQSPESFGAKLLAQLARRLEAERIDFTRSFGDESLALAADRVPIIWECPAAVQMAIHSRQAAVLINDRPRVGLESLFVDSVSTDDYAGGACAAQVLQSHTRATAGFAIIGGPSDDVRSRSRVEGFLSVQPAAVISSANWFYEGGYEVAGQAVSQALSGLFCCNDQIARAVLDYCRQHELDPPPLVGFDDAPVAEALNLTTIAIPWEELVDGVVRVVKRRLAGDRATSSHQVFNPRPILRGFVPV